MQITSLSEKFFSKATPIVGAVALSAIALFGVPESAKASSVDCGPGPDWVENCEAGSDHFPKSWAFIDLWLDVPLLEEILQQNIFPDTFDGHLVGQDQDALIFSGPVWVDREKSFFDGQQWVIPTVLHQNLKGTHPLLGEINLEAWGTGEIFQNPGDFGANSFFDVDFTLEASGLSFFGMTQVVGDRLLKGVSPDKLMNGTPLFDCPHNDPNAAIQYCGDGDLFITVNGDYFKVGTFAETHIVHPRVPEPSAVLAVLGVGGAMLGLKKKQLAKK